MESNDLQMSSLAMSVWLVCPDWSEQNLKAETQ